MPVVVSRPGVGLQAAGHDRARTGESILQVPQLPFQISLLNPPHHGSDRIGARFRNLVGRPAHEQFEQDQTKGEEIGSVIDVVSERLLRCHVQGRAHHRVVGPLGGHPREPEVQDLHLSLGSEHHVLGLQVAMNDVQGLAATAGRGPGLVEAVRNLDAHLHRGLGHDREPRPGALLDHLPERDPLDHLHDDRGLALEELVDLADGAVLHLIQEVELLDEGLHGVRVTGVTQDLDRHLPAAGTARTPARDLSLREVHSPEVPGTELLLHQVVPDVTARQTSPPSTPSVPIKGT